MYLDATTLIQNVYGTKFDDVLVGNNLDNIFYPLDGNDIIDGKSGLNKVIISRAASTFTWATNSSNQHVLLEDKNQKFGSKDLLNIQRVSFSDTNLAFDLNANGAAGKTAEIIGAAFGLNALSNKSYVGIGLRLFDGAMAMQDVASSAISTGLVSNPDNTSFVKAIWNNVVGTPIDEANLNSYVSQLNRGTLSQASLLLSLIHISEPTRPY